MRDRFLVFVLVLALYGVASAQPPGSVRFTEVREHVVRRSVDLPGSVEARMGSAIASEVSGFVVELVAREGTRVKRGAALAKLRRRNLELSLRSAQGELKEAEAQRGRAQRAVERAQRLLEQKLLPEESFDDAQADVLTWEGRSARLQADIERIELDLERCTIRAPYTGVVVAEHIDVGTWINVGDPVVELVSLDALEVRVEVPERYFPYVRAESATNVYADGGVAFPGRITAVIPKADVRARVFPIKVSVDNTNGRLVTGMLVRVSLPIGDEAPATIIPKDAVVSQGPQQVVYVLADDGSLERVPVQPGAGYGAWITVTGLRAGQRVVTRGNERIFPGQKVVGEPLEYELP